MLDSNTIFGIRKYLPTDDYAHGILTQNVESWPCGAPVVYSPLELESGHQAVRVLALMTPSQVSAGIESLNVMSKIVHPVNLKPLYKNHKVLTVSEFDIGKFERLMQFVRDVGGISLVISDKNGRENVADAVRKIQNLWNYTALFYYNAWGGKYLEGKDDSYACLLTFLDLPYCIPLFNMHKIDGVGLSFCGFTKKASLNYGCLHRTFKMDLIYSKYEENLFVVDGVDVNDREGLTDAHYQEAHKSASKDLEVMKPGSKKKDRGTWAEWDNNKKNKYGGYVTFSEQPQWEASNSTIEVNIDNNGEITDEDGNGIDLTDSHFQSFYNSTNGMLFTTGGTDDAEEAEEE